jgi:hypothetical protein
MGGVSRRSGGDAATGGDLNRRSAIRAKRRIETGAPDAPSGRSHVGGITATSRRRLGELLGRIHRVACTAGKGFRSLPELVRGGAAAPLERLRIRVAAFRLSCWEIQFELGRRAGGNTPSNVA